MRLDHLLSKGEEVEIVSLLDCQGDNSNCHRQLQISGGDALRGHTRSHPEHEG